MAKTTIQQFDQNADLNTDINGIFIGEGWQAPDANNAFRALMAMLATYIRSAFALVFGSTVADAAGNAYGIGYRNIPLVAKTAAYTLAVDDAAKGLAITTGGVTVPTNATAAIDIGATIAVYNDSASKQTISAQAGVTLRLAGTATTGQRTLLQRGFATLWKKDTNEWIAFGVGLS